MSNPPAGPQQPQGQQPPGQYGQQPQGQPYGTPQHGGQQFGAPQGRPGAYPGAAGGMPPTPPRKNRTPLLIGLACLILAIVVSGVGLLGGGILLLSGGEEEPTPTPTITDPPTDPETDPATDPETDPATDPETDPATDPDPDPETDPPSDPEPKGSGPGMLTISDDGRASIKVQELLEELDEIPTADGDVKPLQGKWVGAGLTLFNASDEPISLLLEDFEVTTSDGKVQAPMYGRVSVDGQEIPAGETVSIELYVEADEGSTVTSVGYSDDSVDGGEQIIADAPRD